MRKKFGSKLSGGGGGGEGGFFNQIAREVAIGSQGVAVSLKQRPVRMASSTTVFNKSGFV